jgi:hypothetical protein
LNPCPYKRDTVNEALKEYIERRKRLKAAAVDCLIAAMSVTRGAQALGLDADFEGMAPHCPLRLFKA